MRSGTHWPVFALGVILLVAFGLLGFQLIGYGLFAACIIGFMWLDGAHSEQEEEIVKENRQTEISLSTSFWSAWTDFWTSSKIDPPPKVEQVFNDDNEVTIIFDFGRGRVAEKILKDKSASAWTFFKPLGYNGGAQFRASTKSASACALVLTREEAADYTKGLKPYPVGQWLYSIDGVPFGVSDSGEELMAGFGSDDGSVLIAGCKGSGKSSAVNAIVAGLAPLSDVMLLGIDPKGGVELWPWNKRFSHIAVKPEERTKLLKRLYAETERRFALMRSQGIRKLTEPSPEFPAIVLIVDEVARLSDEDRKIMTDIDELGRAGLVNMIRATQDPLKKNMGAGRTQATSRISFQMEEGRQYSLVFGDGTPDLGKAESERQVDKGFGWARLASHGKDIIRFKGYLIEDDQIEQLSAQHANKKVYAEWLPEDPYAQEHILDNTHNIQDAIEAKGHFTIEDSDAPTTVMADRPNNIVDNTRAEKTARSLRMQGKDFVEIAEHLTALGWRGKRGHSTSIDPTQVKRLLGE